jgi:hypothetical protein
MNEKEYEFTNNTCEVWYTDDDGGVQFIANFDWRFGRWDYEGNIEIEVELVDSYQIINGIKHYFYPSISEVNEMIEYIQEHILEDPNDFGFESFIDDERDFQNDQLFY